VLKVTYYPVSTF